MRAIAAENLCHFDSSAVNCFRPFAVRMTWFWGKRAAGSLALSPQPPRRFKFLPRCPSVSSVVKRLSRPRLALLLRAMLNFHSFPLVRERVRVSLRRLGT